MKLASIVSITAAWVTAVLLQQSIEPSSDYTSLSFFLFTAIWAFIWIAPLAVTSLMISRYSRNYPRILKLILYPFVTYTTVIIYFAIIQPELSFDIGHALYSIWFSLPGIVALLADILLSKSDQTTKQAQQDRPPDGYPRLSQIFTPLKPLNPQLKSPPYPPVSSTFCNKNMNPIQTLKEAYKRQDGEAVELALMQCYDKFDRSDYVAVLIDLLLEDWHYKHEDIALELQRIQSPLAVDALHQTAIKKFAYLDYNYSHALARKCTWALCKIGTEEAKQRLIQLTDFEDSEVVSYAQKRLVSWAG